MLVTCSWSEENTVRSSLFFWPQNDKKVKIKSAFNPTLDRGYHYKHLVVFSSSFCFFLEGSVPSSMNTDAYTRPHLCAPMPTRANTSICLHTPTSLSPPLLIHSHTSHALCMSSYPHTSPLMHKPPPHTLLTRTTLSSYTHIPLTHTHTHRLAPTCSSSYAHIFCQRLPHLTQTHLFTHNPMYTHSLRSMLSQTLRPIPWLHLICTYTH